MNLRFWRRPQPQYVLRPKSAIAVLEHDLYGVQPEPGTAASAIIGLRTLSDVMRPTPREDPLVTETSKAEGLVAFIRARLDEDEQRARAAAEDSGASWVDTGDAVYVEDSNDPVAVGPWSGYLPDGVRAHIARHAPARVLADIASKRRLIGNHVADDKGHCRTCAHWTSDWVDGHKVDRLAYEGVRAPCLTLRLLALPYWDHGLYDEDWKP